MTDVKTLSLSLQEGPQDPAPRASSQDGLQPPGPDLPTLPTMRPPRKCPVCKQIEGTTTEDGFKVAFTDGNRRCKVCVVDAQRARRQEKKQAALAMFERTDTTGVKLQELEQALREWVDAHRKLEQEVVALRAEVREGGGAEGHVREHEVIQKQLQTEETERLRAENAIVIGLSNLHNHVDHLKADVAAIKAVHMPKQG